MAADLITRLLEHDPEKRLQIQQIKQHIFLAGRINTKRLHPIEKQTNTLQMSIDCDGNVMMHFRNDNLTINVCHNGLLVDISHHQSMDHEYNFYELPEKYWKHFLYVTKFINLVRSKTRKIIINCGDWLNKTNNRFDNSDSKKFINKCILMNDGHFEVNVYDGILNENSTYQLDEISKSLDHDLKQNVNKLYELYSTTMKLEQTLEIQSKKLGIDLFPITIGIDSKLFETSSSRLSENNSFLTSKILRSIPVNGIGHAIQVIEQQQQQKIFNF